METGKYNKTQSATNSQGFNVCGKKDLRNQQGR